MYRRYTCTCDCVCVHICERVCVCFMTKNHYCIFSKPFLTHNGNLATVVQNCWRRLKPTDYVNK